MRRRMRSRRSPGPAVAFLVRGVPIRAEYYRHKSAFTAVRRSRRPAPARSVRISRCLLTIPILFMLASRKGMSPKSTRHFSVHKRSPFITGPCLPPPYTVGSLSFPGGNTHIHTRGERAKWAIEQRDSPLETTSHEGRERKWFPSPPPPALVVCALSSSTSASSAMGMANSASARHLLLKGRMRLSPQTKGPNF